MSDDTKMVTDGPGADPVGWEEEAIGGVEDSLEGDWGQGFPYGSPKNGKYRESGAAANNNNDSRHDDKGEESNGAGRVDGGENERHERIEAENKIAKPNKSQIHQKTSQLELDTQTDDPGKIIFNRDGKNEVIFQRGLIVNVDGKKKMHNRHNILSDAKSINDVVHIDKSQRFIKNNTGRLFEVNDIQKNAIRKHKKVTLVIITPPASAPSTTTPPKNIMLSTFYNQKLSDSISAFRDVPDTRPLQ